MNGLIRRLAGLFGTAPFTTAQARRDLAVGIEAPMPARSLGNELRAAVGQRVTDGARTFVLRHAGTAHNGMRRWQFEPVIAPATNLDEELI